MTCVQSFKTRTGPAGRPGPGTGPGGGKNPLGNWPGETRSTRDPVHPVKLGWDPADLYIIVPSALSFVNSSRSLAILDLSFNHLSSSIVPWLSNSSDILVDLDLSANQLQGSIPDSFGKMTSLMNLHLADNQLEGGIPRSFRGMCSLRELDMSSNNLSGPLPLGLLLWDDIIAVVVKGGIALVFCNLLYAFEKELWILKLRRWWWACGGCGGSL